MDFWAKLKKITYRQELEFTYAIQILIQLSILIYYFDWHVPFELSFGIVLANLIIYYFQLIRLRKKNIRFDRILGKKFKQVDIVQYLTSIDEFKSSLISLNEPDEIAKLVCNYIYNVFNPKTIFIFLWDEKTGSFRPVSWKNKEENDTSDLFFYVYDPFILWLYDYSGILEKKDLKALFGSNFNLLKKGEEFFDKTQANLVAPLNLNKGLLGILAIGSFSNKNNELSQEERKHLQDVIETSIMALSNSIFYKQLISMTENLEAKVKERTRALEEAQAQLVMSEKMASLGVMVAGIAHEINTPAGVINAASDNLNDNIIFIIRNIFRINNYLKDEKIRKPFWHILSKLLRNQNTPVLSSTEKFKLKKEYKNYFRKLGLDEGDASDAAVFVLENNLQDKMEEVYSLYNHKAYPMLDFLRAGLSVVKNIRNIKHSIRNIVRIVKALKYYSHLDQSSFGEADITESIENTIIILQNQIKKGIEIVREYGNIPKIYCNLDELNQVWTNLLNNAIHAVKNTKNPKITIKTEPISLAGKKYILVTFQDNGIGIPPEIKDRIWDPFFTTKDQGEGSGLGLGIVKSIIDKHKGTIKVESKPGNTQFMVYLPIDPIEDSTPPKSNK